jgi:transitional endoplasmic reticulum ATPase
MVGQPDPEGREEILKIHTQSSPLAPDVSLRELAEITDDYVGSDLANIAREAAMESLREDPEAEDIAMRHFRRAMESVRPTVTEELMNYYEQVEEEFGGTTGAAPDTTTGELGFQ